MSGCLILLIQLPIILAFAALRDPITYVFKSKSVYEAISKIFFGFQI